MNDIDPLIDTYRLLYLRQLVVKIRHTYRGFQLYDFNLVRIYTL